MLKGKIKKKLESVITCSYFNKKMYIIIILYYYFRYNLNFGVFWVKFLSVLAYCTLRIALEPYSCWPIYISCFGYWGLTKLRNLYRHMKTLYSFIMHSRLCISTINTGDFWEQSRNQIQHFICTEFTGLEENICILRWYTFSLLLVIYRMNNETISPVQLAMILARILRLTCVSDSRKSRAESTFAIFLRNSGLMTFARSTE